MHEGIMYYVTVTAVNKVGLQSYSFSNPIAIDTTPPKYGKVVDLHTTYRMDVRDNELTVRMNAKACTTDAGREELIQSCKLIWSSSRNKNTKKNMFFFILFVSICLML